MYNIWHKKRKQRQFSTIKPKTSQNQPQQNKQNKHFAIYLKKTLTFLYFQKTKYYICKEKEITSKNNIKK